jgi:hypothetical protein
MMHGYAFHLGPLSSSSFLNRLLGFFFRAPVLPSAEGAPEVVEVRITEVNRSPRIHRFPLVYLSPLLWPF